jgi:hypothetical protein
MVTELEVLDTAVKIGLGALITGVGSYFGLRLKHKHETERGQSESLRELEKERRARNREKIEAIAASLGQNGKAFRRVLHAYENHFHTADGVKEIHACIREYANSFDDLSAARGAATLLGEENLFQALEAYWLRSESLYHYIMESGEHASIDSINEILNDDKDCYTAVRTAVAEVYTKYN